MELGKTLSYWIAESESWQAFIDFNISHEFISNYNFIKRPEDFYITLMCNTFDLFKIDNEYELSEKYLALGKGLEIFSLERKRNNFSGVNYANNILFVAGLYYLAGYSASSCILAHKFPLDEYGKSIDEFILLFLSRRDRKNENKLNSELNQFLTTGDFKYLDALKYEIEINLSVALEEDYDAFASYKLAKVIINRFEANNIWTVLLAQDDDKGKWKKYVNACIKKKHPIWTFFPSQRLAIEKGILSDKTFSLQMPTSAGKTAISELVIYHELKFKQFSKILYLAPFRALASELKSSMCRDLAKLGISSKSIYGGNTPTSEEKSALSGVDVLISTPEKLLAVEDVEPGLLDSFTTVICDEGHLLDDSTRGLSYELLLSRLKSSFLEKRFIFISAIIPNISTINQWLGGDDDSVVNSVYRPTQLEYAFLMPMVNIKAYYLNVNPNKDKPENYQLYKYITSEDLKVKDPKTKKNKTLSSKKSISVAVALKALNLGCVALFAPHKKKAGGVEELSEELLYQISNNIELNKPSYYTEINHLENLVEYLNAVFGKEYLLSKLANEGALFHHGDLPQFIREVVEDSVRQGHVKLVICNNTLSEGVNLPIRTIVIHATKRFDMRENRPIDLKLRDLKNLVGRAGRAGKETKGLIIIPHESDQALINNLINDVNIEPVTGRLHQIVKQIDELLRSGRIILSNEFLDCQQEWLLQLLDSIETSLIDLLSEEVSVNELKTKVDALVKDTLAYSISDEEEKETLSNLVNLRSGKLVPYIENGSFKNLKNSGSTLRFFNEVNAVFNFSDDIWLSDFDIDLDSWKSYLFVDGIFKLPSFNIILNEFNQINKTNVNGEEIILAAKMWINGEFYPYIGQAVNLEVAKVINLIHSLIGFNLQDYISKLIRIKELSLVGYSASSTILNLPHYLQHGIGNQIELDLVEIGLNERISLLRLYEYLVMTNYKHDDALSLKRYLIKNVQFILDHMKNEVPKLSFDKLKNNLYFLQNSKLL